MLWLTQTFLPVKNQQHSPQADFDIYQTRVACTVPNSDRAVLRRAGCQQDQPAAVQPTSDRARAVGMASAEAQPL